MFLDESDGAFFALSVIDYELMIGWYTKHLGFRIEADTGMKIFGIRDPEGILIQFFKVVDKDV